MPVSPDSFTFRGVDMYAEYGIRGIVAEVLAPRLRPRLLTIPSRSGSYDFGAKHYDDRTITIDCDSRAALSREKLRELSYLLSKKGELTLWDEPDKYYMGRLYNAEALTYIGRVGHSFSLTFVCEPFAYGETKSERLMDRVVYRGTAPTPTRIQITNQGEVPIRGIRMRIRERSDA